MARNNANMSRPKVSVVIPVYGVEKYIERCARSLMEQTLDDIEYIFIDDCTEDNSMSILDNVIKEFPNRKPQVVIHRMEHNSGIAAVRKWGILNASGQYIIHCDSDDFVDRDMYRLMYEKAVTENLDIVVCDYYEGFDGSWAEKKGIGSESVDLIENALLFFLSAMWNKLIKSKIVQDPSIVFPTNNMGEDMILVCQYALISEKIGYVDIPLYYDRRHHTSLTSNRSHEALLDNLRQFVLNFDIVIDSIARKGQNDRYKDAILHECLNAKNSILPALPFTDSYKLWRNTYKEINSKVLFSKMFTFREKLNFVITYLGLYPLYYKFTRRTN